MPQETHSRLRVPRQIDSQLKTRPLELGIDLAWVESPHEKQPARTKPTFYTPWINVIPNAAVYAYIRESRMRQLVKGGVILSRNKPKDENGHRPRGVLV